MSTSRKPFHLTTRAEREAMTDEELLSYSQEERRSCGDCRYLKAYVTWWCVNEEAVACRGTAIPGVCLCDFWEPYRPSPEPSQGIHDDGRLAGAVIAAFVLTAGVLAAFAALL